MIKSLSKVVTAKEISSGIGLPPPLVFEFFTRFARFEYALKASGFVRQGPFNAALPDWSRFARSVGSDLCQTTIAEINNACRFLIGAAPMVQKLSDGKIAFVAEVLPGANDGEKAIEAIKRVRNNLFHGGKHVQHSETGRDEELLRQSLVILDACLSAASEVRSAYEDLPI